MMFDIEQARQDMRESGYHIIPGVLGLDQLERIRTAIEKTIEKMSAEGVSTHTDFLDPNDSNIRLYNLPNWDPAFVELLSNPIARRMVELTLGPNYLLSNYTGNIALPGSQPMRLHSDQATSMPAPWYAPWAMNIVWCIDDVHEGNGATRFVLGSHKWETFEDVPSNPEELSVAFEAPAGSIIAMEGRLWHQSGRNTTTNERRAMLFNYYLVDFLRLQTNWEICLSPEVKASLSQAEKELLGFGPVGNTRMGAELTRLYEGYDRSAVFRNHDQNLAR